MSWWRDAWNLATYRRPLSAYLRDYPSPSLEGRWMSTEFGPTLYARYPGLVDALGGTAVHWSPAELRRFLAERAPYVEPVSRFSDAA